MKPDPSRARLCLVRGSGDIASAVAHRLVQAGHRVALHDVCAPAYPRRGMSFVDAYFDGVARVEGVTARLAPDVRRMAAGGGVRAFEGELDELLDAARPDVLVDARMRKRDVPERQLHLAPATIGVGPNFVARVTTHLAVETAWGEALGSVVADGCTRSLEGEPRAIGGHARDRFLYAPAAGCLQTDRRVGERVRAGERIGFIADRVLHAPIDGVLLGVTRNGVFVPQGAKIFEVDPRGDARAAFRIGERQHRIAAGVLAALDRLWGAP